MENIEYDEMLFGDLEKQFYDNDLMAGVELISRCRKIKDFDQEEIFCQEFENRIANTDDVIHKGNACYELAKLMKFGYPYVRKGYKRSV